jgi:hypothetical protein
MPTNTYVALQTQTLGTAASSVTFSSIPAGYTDLVLVMNGTLSTSAAVYCEFNGDTASNYSSTYIQGQSGTASSGRDTRLYLFGFLTSGSGPNTGIANIQNYSNTTTFKTVLSRANDSSTVNANVGLWRGTPAAINSINLIPTGGTFSIGTTFTIYGIAAASVGAKATGGTVYSDDLYYYHVFGSTGTFTPLQSLSADVLVVAGGAAGGADYGGGGGAGGILTYSSQSLTATGYTCTVGAGGASGSSRGASGSNSQFAALTASLGGGGGGSNDGNYTGNSGGSGGGGAGTSAGGAGTAGQGFAGATGGGGAAGGGGGAGAAAPTAGKNGGIGSNSYTTWVSATGTGISGYYSGGGGGGAVSGGTGGLGGTGGGANGGNSGVAGSSAAANTGGGGGGGAQGGANSGGAGGSGLVIIRYAKA